MKSFFNVLPILQWKQGLENEYLIPKMISAVLLLFAVDLKVYVIP